MIEKDKLSFDKRQLKIDKKSVLTGSSVKNMYDILKFTGETWYSNQFLLQEPIDLTAFSFFKKSRISGTHVVFKGNYK